MSVCACSIAVEGCQVSGKFIIVDIHVLKRKSGYCLAFPEIKKTKLYFELNVYYMYCKSENLHCTSIFANYALVWGVRYLKSAKIFGLH